MRPIYVFLILLVSGTAAAQGTSESRHALTNRDVIQMASVKTPEDTIILAIEGGDTDFDVSDVAVRNLRARGISDKVIAAMRKAKPGSQIAGAAGRAAHDAPLPVGGTITNDAVIQMTAGGLTADVVATAIQNAESTEFDTTPGALVALKQLGISDVILKAMIETEARKRKETIAIPTGSAGVEAAAETATAAADPSVASMRAEIQRLERRLGELQGQYQKKMADSQNSRNSANLGRNNCDKSSTIGALNCLSADLNDQVAASSDNAVRRLEIDIQNVQGQLNALRMAAVNSPHAAAILAPSPDPSPSRAGGAENPVGVKPAPSSRPTLSAGNAPAGRVHAFQVKETTAFKHVPFKKFPKGMLRIGAGRLEWTPDNGKGAFSCPLEEAKLSNPKMEGGFYASCATGESLRFAGKEKEIFAAFEKETAGIQRPQ